MVAVTAGAVKWLTRDELQGVIGHEFSHILNGDMRLNLRLMGLVFGILCLAVIGYYVMLSAGYISSQPQRKKGPAGGLPAGSGADGDGLAGRLLRPAHPGAVSRQREFLADASSVQFTRNPAGLAGALKKIGGLALARGLAAPRRGSQPHVLRQRLCRSFFHLLETHPPLADRIRPGPDFDGRFPGGGTRGGGPGTRRGDGPAARGRHGGTRGTCRRDRRNGRARRGVASEHLLRWVHNPEGEVLGRLGDVAQRLPPPLTAAARDPFAAPAVIYALLSSGDDESVRARQMQLLEGAWSHPSWAGAAAGRRRPGRAAGGRLSLIDLAIPSLKRSSPQQYQPFRENVSGLVNAAGGLDLFEYCLCRMLFSYLDVHFGLRKPPSPRFRTVSSVAGPAAVVLSMLRTRAAAAG